MFKVKFTFNFEKDIKKLNRQIANRIIEKIEFLALNSEHLKNFVKYLPKDLEGLQKYRVGDWRILFWG
ncbi:type II toxin-antitoxin system RelE/ParE family toxin [bacterium (Candidatus Gribaldobacteria) CG08_land_8_20_14_0_20_39_15]|uniref:Type II toxin-antitoxin system RelE/ParE family toxin n=1 Tax=bacterium (Candidatus Gribaldobacteria) CG08_land_8_20_14_0_20_39_15 TaxID=2014273 RepID=A0A2M6XUD3_9BACT|nr:MAG: type II toxin-antitoxin system RelE/ParE family toxin [bacterium (Candidatus Gribaldobacteria) CG08_land_8_20_14_0_20_39_15]